MPKQGDGFRHRRSFQDSLQFGADNVPHMLIGPVDSFRFEGAADKRCHEYSLVGSAARKKRGTEERPQQMQSLISRRQKAEATQRFLDAVFRKGSRGNYHRRIPDFPEQVCYGGVWLLENFNSAIRGHR